MSQRIHNIYFHLHTVSGIAISIGLFVIFFAGAFSLFMDPIKDWEQEKYSESYAEQASSTANIDYNRVVDSLQSRGVELYGRNLNFHFEDKTTSLSLSKSVDTLASNTAKKNLSFILKDYNLIEQEARGRGRTDSEFSLGRLLYLLHYYYQLGKPGYYLAGLVSLFFLLALVTGVIVHWKKITMNFFVFRPKQKLKTVWTDAHTVLGTIGIPFQFLYALSGCMFGLGVLVYTSSALLYDGEVKEVYKVMFPRDGEQALGAKTDIDSYDFNSFYNQAEQHWDEYTPTAISILQIGSTSQQFKSYGFGSIKQKFVNQGELVIDTQTNEIVRELSPYNKAYSDTVRGLMYRLHFADFGGLGNFGNALLKIIYFLMALLTCFVIITGILIWLEARNKKNIPEKKKRYNQNVGHIYLAICLSMLPITAAAFIFTSFLPNGPDRELWLNCFYFIGWLLLSLFFWRKKSNVFTTKYTLFFTGILGLCIPIVNGISSSNWLWLSLMQGNYNVLIIDLLWLLLAALCLYAVKKSNLKKQQSKPSL